MSMTTELELAQRMKAAAIRAKAATEDYVANRMSMSVCLSECEEFNNLSDGPDNIIALVEALEAAEKRNAELEANQQKIESMSAYSDERLEEIERHRDNSLLGDLPADLARELRQTRSRLGNYYELLRRADVAERKVSNLTVTLRANGVNVEDE